MVSLSTGGPTSDCFNHYGCICHSKENEETIIQEEDWHRQERYLPTVVWVGMIILFRMIIKQKKTLVTNYTCHPIASGRSRRVPWGLPSYTLSSFYVTLSTCN